MQVRDVAATFIHIWERVGEILAELDVLVSFAHAAATASTPYVCPEMLSAESGEISLKQCRHPCLELQEGIDVIPNDCVMQRGESWFQIITGPNMGGKSTFIRQVCAYMRVCLRATSSHTGRLQIAQRLSVFIA
jgi:DNA mismatch repair protein MSH2